MSAPLAPSAPPTPSALLLSRHRSARGKIVASAYGEHLHAWLIAKGERAFVPFSRSMSWEQFRADIAPYLCSEEMPMGTVQTPLPCRKVGPNGLRWKNVSLLEAKKGGFYWRNKLALRQWVTKDAIARLGEGMKTVAGVSVDPLIGGMGRGAGHRDLVGKEVAWNEGVEDESMWNESEEEGDDDGTTGGKRWFLHKPKETREKMRMRLAVEEDEDEEMKTDDDQETIEEGDGEQGEGEETESEHGDPE